MSSQSFPRQNYLLNGLSSVYWLTTVISYIKPTIEFKMFSTVTTGQRWRQNVFYSSSYREDDPEIKSKHCTSSRIRFVVSRIFLTLKKHYKSTLFPVYSIAQLVEHRRRNPDSISHPPQFNFVHTS